MLTFPPFTKISLAGKEVLAPSAVTARSLVVKARPVRQE